MNRLHSLYIAIAVVVLLGLVAGVSMAQEPATNDNQGDEQLQASVGSAITYQGQLQKNGDPINLTCSMKFSLYNQATGGILVAGPLPKTVPVSDGLFTVKLDFGSSVYKGQARWLGIQVQCPGDAAYVDLGRQELTAIPYSLYSIKTPYQNVVTVAKNGGDYTSVQAAINSITDAAANKPYLVWVAPGTYNEYLVMKPYLHLQGAGQGITIISSTAGGTNPLDPAVATIVLASNCEISDLTVVNLGTSYINLGLSGLDGTSQITVADTTILAQGVGGNQNIGIYLYGASSQLTLNNVTVVAENGSVYNHGVLNYDATMIIEGGSFTARGGDDSKGIYNYSNHTNLTARGVTVLAENAASYTRALYNGQGITSTLYGGTFIARGGTNTYGVYNTLSDLTAEGVTFVGEGGSGENYGVYSSGAGDVILSGSSITASGGNQARGLYNAGGSNLEANQVTALGKAGYYYSYGLYNNGATAHLSGGTYIGRGILDSWGIFTTGDTSDLHAEGIHAIADGGFPKFGFQSTAGAPAELTQSVFEGENGPVVSMLPTGGAVRVSNSRLVGLSSGNNVTCIADSRGNTFNTSGCP